MRENSSAESDVSKSISIELSLSNSLDGSYVTKRAEVSTVET